MDIDIRTPIGLLFMMLGMLLVVYGATSDPQIYGRSLGINLNVQWGSVLLVCGMVFLFFGRRAADDRITQKKPSADSADYADHAD